MESLGYCLPATFSRDTVTGVSAFASTGSTLFGSPRDILGLLSLLSDLEVPQGMGWAPVVLAPLALPLAGRIDLPAHERAISAEALAMLDAGKLDALAGRIAALNLEEIEDDE